MQPIPRRDFLKTTAGAATAAISWSGGLHAASSLDAEAHMPTWARKFTQPSRYKCVYGGLGSGKSWTFAHLLISEATQKPIRVACCRPFQSNIWESVKQGLEDAIHRLGFADQFQVHKDRVTSSKGAEFFFRGTEADFKETIRDWGNVDRVWLEEAHLIKNEAHSDIVSTIRKADAEIWYSWKPLSRLDWVWQRFVVNPRPGDIIEKVNFHKNPWFPAKLEEERLANLRLNPDLYAHIWEGEPYDG